MKSMTTMAVAAVLALTGAGFASATTVYHVSGSTAFRAAVVTAEVSYLKSITNSAPYAATYASSAPSSLAGASVSYIVSTDGSVAFSNSFNGSIAGVEAINSIGNKINFPNGVVVTGSLMSSTYQTTAGSATALATGGSWAGAAVTVGTNGTANYPDIIFSDVDSNTAQTVIQSYVPGQAAFTDASSGNSSVVGIVPFIFAAGATTDVTDFSTVSVNPQNFSNLWSSGTVTGSFFTGNSADTNIKVYALGRDIDSGTRATALAETGYGLAGQGAVATIGHVTQYYPLDTTGSISGVASTVNPINAFEKVPASTVDGASLGIGNGGYASGGNLGVALTTKFNSNITHTVIIGYIGLADLASALNTDTASNRQAPIQLGYAGSFITDTTSSSVGALSTGDVAKIQYGAYTFWTYENEQFLENNGVDPTSVAGSLQGLLAGGTNAANTLDQLSSGGVSYLTMKVARSDDGLQVQ